MHVLGQRGHQLRALFVHPGQRARCGIPLLRELEQLGPQHVLPADKPRESVSKKNTDTATDQDSQDNTAPKAIEGGDSRFQSSRQSDNALFDFAHATLLSGHAVFLPSLLLLWIRRRRRFLLRLLGD